MEELTDNNIPVSSTGLKIVQDGFIDPQSATAEAKLAEKYEKQKLKDAEKAKSEKKKKLKKEYKAEVKEIKKGYKELKKEDTSEFTRGQKFKRHMPVIFTTTGGKPTGYD